MNKLEALRRINLGGIRRRLKPNAYAVLIYYVWRMNDTGEAWPSAGTIATDLQMDSKHAERARSELVREGLLISGRPILCRKTWSKVFVVVLPEVTIGPPADSAPPQNAPPRESRPVPPAKCAPAPPQNAPQDPPQNAPPKSVIEPINEPVREPHTPDACVSYPGFEKWKQEYPCNGHGVSELEAACRLWIELNLEPEADRIIENTRANKASDRWLRLIGIPRPSKYLSDRVFDSAPLPPPPKSKRERHKAEYAQSLGTLPNAGEGDAVEQARNRLAKALNLTGDETKAFTKELRREFDNEYVARARPGSNFTNTIDQTFGLDYELNPKKFEGIDKATWCSAELERRIARGLSWVLAAKIATLPPTIRDPSAPVAEQLRTYRVARLQEKGIEPEQRDQPPATPTPEELAERERKRRRDDTLNTIGHRGRQNLLKALCQKQPDKADDWRHRDIYLDNELRDRLYELHQAGQTRHCVAHVEN